MHSSAHRRVAFVALSVVFCLLGPAAEAGSVCKVQESPAASGLASADQRTLDQSARCLQIAQLQSSPCGNDRQCWGTPWSDNAKQYICCPMAKTCRADQDGYPACK